MLLYNNKFGAGTRTQEMMMVNRLAIRIKLHQRLLYAGRPISGNRSSTIYAQSGKARSGGTMDDGTLNNIGYIWTPIQFRIQIKV